MNEPNLYTVRQDGELQAGLPVSVDLASLTGKKMLRRSIVCLFELFFLLFVHAGRFKADPRFAWIPFDVTVFFFSLSVVTGGFAFVLRTFRFTKLSIRASFMGVALFAFIALSYCWTPSSVYATEKIARVVVLTQASFLGAALIIAQSTENVRTFMRLQLLFSTWVAVEVGLDSLQSSGGFIDAMGGGYLGEGLNLAIGGLIAFFAAVTGDKSRIRRVAWGVVAMVFAYLLFQTGARMALFVFLLGIPAILVQTIECSTISGIRFSRYSARAGMVFLALVICLLAYTFFASNSAMTLVRVRVLTVPGLGASASVRLSYWIAALDLWLRSPIIGHGIGSWPILMGFGEIRSFPHNILLELFVEQGVLGVAAFLALLWCVLRIRGRHRLVRSPFQKRSLRSLLLAVWLACFAYAMVHGHLADNRELFAFTGMLAWSGGELK